MLSQLHQPTLTSFGEQTMRADAMANITSDYKQRPAQTKSCNLSAGWYNT